MAFDLKTIEALAPDQASLSAASKLTKRSSWVRLERQDALLWGECQGSGANPYRVVVDAGDQGYKCTCPSRKFPCKHSLALMWISATAPDNFSPAGEVPEWVNDWLGRRRKSGAPAAPTASGAKSIDEAQADQPTVNVEDPQAAERREAAQKKRAEDTKASISAGLDELDQWISDQLRLGLSSFVNASGERCRRISARLVDAKAAALASRIDELPGLLMVLRNEERPEAAIRELGKLVLLANAWRTSPDDAELKRLVSTSETREQILSQTDALQVTSTWEVLGERIVTKRDGLVSHATWLIDLMCAEPRFALLQDFYPASAGRRSQAFSAGERFDARLVYYPARAPLRALVAERGHANPDVRSWPPASARSVVDPLASHVARQDVAPWSSETPILLSAGALARDDRGNSWWQSDLDANGMALPVAGSLPEAVFGIHLGAAAALWDGSRLSLLAAESAFGRLDLS